MVDEVESVETPARRPRPWLAMSGLLLATTLLVYVFAGRFGQDPRLVESPLIGEPLPELTLEFLEQEGSLTLSDLQGSVLVVNFWASWCPPCRIEHPILTSASAAYGEDGVIFVGVVYQDQRDNAIRFLDDFGRGENYLYVFDEDSRATVEMGVFGVPETFFVDADGIIRGRVQGEVDAEKLVDNLEAILAPDSAGS